MRTLLSWLVFPLLLGATVVATTLLLGSALPRPAVSALAIVSLTLTLLVLERMAPFRPEWNRRPDGKDLALLVGNRVVDVGLLAGTAFLVERLPPWLHLWPATLPLAAQAGIGILVAEAIRYALHRLSHGPGLLGRVHETHHQPRRMYTLNGPRLHPGNQLWLSAATILPMRLLGAELDAVILALVVTVFFVLFQHANLRLRFDVWNTLFATPDVHRLHHHRELQGTPVNYGIVVLLFDRLFGTYRPAEPGLVDLG